jgi:hypothetical protein
MNKEHGAGATSVAMEISIQGQRIPVRSGQEDPDKAQAAIELVAEKIREAERRSKPSTAPHQIALLALLDLASDHVRMREKTAAFQRNMSEKSGRLISLLESELK